MVQTPPKSLAAPPQDVFDSFPYLFLLFKVFYFYPRKVVYFEMYTDTGVPSSRDSMLCIMVTRPKINLSENIC